MFFKYKFQGLLIRAALFSLVLLLALCSENSEPQKDNRVPKRIISLAPSITETLFALGVEDRVVGVTSFCAYPPGVKRIRKIGTYLDPNFEAILTLQPDLVILLKENAKVKEFCDAKGITFLLIDNHNIDAIIESITLIGEACGKGHKAKLLGDAIVMEFDTASFRSASGKECSRPRVLLCVGRSDVGSGVLSKLWVAGPNTHYSEIIDAAGGINVISDSTMDYSTISSEAVIRLKPDIIIDVMAGISQFSPEQVKGDWEKLTMVPAVQNRMIFCLTEDYITIPGPRIVLLLRDVKKVIGEYYTVLTGALHVDGLGDVADGFGSGKNKERILE